MEHRVYLYIYDLSKGILEEIPGQKFEGIWHTGVVINGTEYWYGRKGINCCKQPGSTPFGRPKYGIYVGKAKKTMEDFLCLIWKLNQEKFHGHKYDLLHHNCNIFSNYITKYLCGKCIPAVVLKQPGEFLKTDIGVLFD
jgi:desumoylating isopeptidase 1